MAYNSNEILLEVYPEAYVTGHQNFMLQFLERNSLFVKAVKASAKSEPKHCILLEFNRVFPLEPRRSVLLSVLELARHMRTQEKIFELAEKDEATTMNWHFVSDYVVTRLLGRCREFVDVLVPSEEDKRSSSFFIKLLIAFVEEAPFCFEKMETICEPVTIVSKIRFVNATLISTRLESKFFDECREIYSITSEVQRTLLFTQRNFHLTKQWVKARVDQLRLEYGATPIPMPEGKEEEELTAVTRPSPPPLDLTGPYVPPSPPTTLLSPPLSFNEFDEEVSRGDICLIDLFDVEDLLSDNDSSAEVTSVASPSSPRPPPPHSQTEKKRKRESNPKTAPKKVIEIDDSDVYYQRKQRKRKLSTEQEKEKKEKKKRSAVKKE